MNNFYKTVMTAAAEQCGTTFEQVVTRGKQREASTARYVAWYILNNHFGWSQSQIARQAVLFSRITIRYGINRIAEMPSTSSVGEIVERTLASVSIV